MPAYDYKGIIGEKNTYTDGIIEAINEDEAAFRLREQKIIIISLSKSKKKSASDKTKKKKANGVDEIPPEYLKAFSSTSEGLQVLV